MNVTEFAEQIVFGKTLEDKLLVPGKLTIDARSTRPNVDSLVAPGRPAGLQMRHGRGGNIQPPSDERLENEQARGQLLHFLANHELLATELMALVLLKFPDAPHAFRQGILVTLQEEQEHTRMYIRRMKECGVEFGSYPLSGQFWRVIEPMQSPMDFVSRLSLTFEQANLDYSLHFANVFRKLGDTQTAAVLQQIYEDEIGHVQHGLHWFRQWKNPEHSDWEAYQASLEFPMSPQRGRGPRGAFNRSGRVQAGLTEAFIDAIEVFRQSRGRAPTVRWFDPGAEVELSGEDSPRIVSLMGQLANDLELVMAAIARQDDVVLVHRNPSREFRKQLIDFGFELPEFTRFEDSATLIDRKLHDFSPWAWTPRSHAVARPLVASAHHPPPRWSESNSNLFRKSWGADCLRRWLRDSGRDGEAPEWFANSDSAGIPVYEFNDVLDVLSDLAKRGYTSSIVKRDLASSGRGQRRLPCHEALSLQDEAWLRFMFSSDKSSLNNRQPTSVDGQFHDSVQRQPVGIVEPELDRLVDLSFLWDFRRDAEAPSYLGWTRPLVTQGRRYSGTRLGSVFSDCDQRLRQFILANRCARLETVAQWLADRITPELITHDFSGYFGVDAFVYQDQAGELKIKPLVELNPRTTMGHVVINLEKRLAPGTEAEYRIFTKSEWDKLNLKLVRIPFTKSNDGRWQSGVVWLSEVDQNSLLIPALLVGNQAIQIAKTKKGSGANNRE